MSGEFLIFENALIRDNTGEQLYINLSTDKETPFIGQLLLQNITLKTMFSTVTPFCSISFMDRNGRVMSEQKLDYDAIYYFSFGNNPFESQTTLPLKISTVKFSNETAHGKPLTKNVSFTINFVHAFWSEMTNTRRSRSWSERRFSDIVSDIAKDGGYASSDIDQSSFIRNTMVQPHSTNASFLRYIQQRAKPLSFDDSFQYGCTLRGKFIFKPFSSMIEEQKAAAVDGDIPTLFMKPVSQIKQKRENSRNDNGGVPDNFFYFNGNETHLENTIDGGGGVTAAYYDFENGEYVTRDLNVGDLSTHQLTDQSPMLKSQSTSQKMCYFGTDKNFIGRGKLNIGNAINSLVILTTKIEGTTNLELGDMVEMIFPVQPQQDTDSPFSDIYSGFYLVVGIEHRFDITNNAFSTKLNLMRNGYNGGFLTDPQNTKLGKFVK